MLASLRSGWLFAFIIGLGMAGSSQGDDAVVVQVLDNNGKPVPKAVVYYETDDPWPVDPATRAVVDQMDIAFVPDLTVVQAGTTVEFPNSDKVSHHVYSFVRPNAFELPLYKRELTPAVLFDHAGVVILGCNIHDSMLAYIVVVDTPYFGITGSDGTVELPGVPVDAGEFVVWSQRLDPAQQLKLIVDPSDRKTNAVVLRASHRLRPLSRTGTGSLAWDDY